MTDWPIVQRPLSKRSSRSRDLIEYSSSAIWLRIRYEYVEREKPFGFSEGPRIVFITSLSTFFFLFHFLSILPQLENWRKWSGTRISRVEGKNVYRSMLRWFFWRTQITAVTDRNRKLRHYARQLRLSQRVGQYFLSKMGTVRQEIKVTELCHGD